MQMVSHLHAVENILLVHMQLQAKTVIEREGSVTLR
jgi:hypothetical protein